MQVVAERRHEFLGEVLHLIANPIVQNIQFEISLVLVHRALYPFNFRNSFKAATSLQYLFAGHNRQGQNDQSPGRRGNKPTPKAASGC